MSMSLILGLKGFVYESGTLFSFTMIMTMGMRISRIIKTIIGTGPDIKNPKLTPARI
jgi:hypothetical protein